MITQPHGALSQFFSATSEPPARFAGGSVICRLGDGKVASANRLRMQNSLFASVDVLLYLSF